MIWSIHNIDKILGMCNITTFLLPPTSNTQKAAHKKKRKRNWITRPRLLPRARDNMYIRFFLERTKKRYTIQKQKFNFPWRKYNIHGKRAKNKKFLSCCFLFLSFFSLSAFSYCWKEILCLRKLFWGKRSFRTFSVFHS